MASVDIRPIELPRDAMAFVKSWWSIYRDDPLWVPPLLSERRSFFDPGRNPYFRHAEVRCFMAFRDGKPVGTISAQVDSLYQPIEPGVGFFGFFEFADDAEVAGGLLRAACDWLRARGMTEARGPFNFSINHEFGCLIDGFDTPPAVLNPHGRPYYPPILESLGLVKARDWYAYWMEKRPVPANLETIAQRFLARHPEVSIRRLDLGDFERVKGLVREIYEDAWAGNWGHTPLPADEFDFLASQLKALLHPDLAWVAYVNDEPAAVSITFPDFNQVARRMNGRMFPIGWLHFLLGRRHIDQLRAWILGVKHQYQHLPLGTPLYLHTWRESAKMPIRGAEASLVLEDNLRMRGAAEKLGGRIYKTYRTWSMPLVPTESVAAGRPAQPGSRNAR